MFKWDRSHSEVGDTLRYFNSMATSSSSSTSRSTELLSLMQQRTHSMVVVQDHQHQLGRVRANRLSISSALASCARPHQLSISSTSELSQVEAENRAGAPPSGSISIILHPPDDDEGSGAQQEVIDTFIDDHDVYVKALDQLLNDRNDANTDDIECIWSAPELLHLFQDATVPESTTEGAIGGRSDIELPSSSRIRHHASDGQVVPLRRLMPCIKSQTFDDQECENDEAHMDLDGHRWPHLADSTLATTHRSILARTSHKYLTLNAISCTEKLFTASLIVLTLVAIVGLFWYQNFGPGFHLNSSH